VLQTALTLLCWNFTSIIAQYLPVCFTAFNYVQMNIFVDSIFLKLYKHWETYFGLLDVCRTKNAS